MEQMELKPYVKDNQLSLSLLRFHVKINILSNSRCIYHQLTITDSERNTLTFNFYTLEDAIGFIQNIVNKSKDFNEIIHKYEEEYEHNNFKGPKVEPREDQEKGIVTLSPEEILRETDFDINKIKKSIQENNIYYNDEEKNNYTNKINNIKESRNKNMLKTYINNSQENNQLFKGKKYKYYNEHIQRIKRYKEDGIFAKILSQQESLYSPHFDYIFKKIYSGPKWDKLTGREDLFKPVKKKPNININISTEKKNKKKN